jgi:putative ABC transport system permease protein
MNLLTLAFRNLLRRPIRSTLTIMGVTIAVGSAVALVSLGRGIESNAEQSTDERGADLVLTRRGASEMFGGALSQDLEAKIAALPGVDAVAGEIVMFSTTQDGQHVLVAGWTRASFFWPTLPLASGRRTTADDHRVVLLGDAVAQSLSKKLGDTLELMDEKFTVIGITKYQSVINRGLVIMPIADLQEVAFRPDQVTMFDVRLKRGLPAPDLDRLKAKFAELGPILVSSSASLMRNDRYVAVLNSVSLAMSLIALGMGVLNVLNTLLMAVQERTREIGIVASIGWSDSLIVGLILIEGMLLGAIGCLAGMGLGYAASGLFSAIPAVGKYVTFSPTLPLMIIPACIAFVLCVFGSLYPAWRAVRMNPAEALRRI